MLFSRTSLVLLIVVELLAIAWLTYWIFEKREVATFSELSPMASEAITSTSTERLEYFYEPKPGVAHNFHPPWLEQKPHNTINGDTLNERFDYDREKPRDTYRIVTLGDSWVYGQFVSTNMNFSEQLENDLNETLSCDSIEKFEVINLGVGSYDLAYAVERFDRRGAKYDPDLVIWLLLNNDFDEINEFLRPRVAELEKELEIKRNQLEYDEYEGLEDTFVDSGDPVAARAWIQAREDQLEEIGPEEMTEYQRDYLDEFYELHNGSLLFYTLPRMMSIDARGRGILQNFTAETADTEWYSTELKLDENTERLPDAHPNPAGHTRIAEDLFGYLLENDYFDCVET